MLAAMALAIGAAGCRSDPYRDAYLEMLNAEKRALEDRLYEVQYEYEQAVAELKAERGSTEKNTSKPTGRARTAEPDRRQSEPQTDEPIEVPDLPEIELPPGVEEGKRRQPGLNAAAARAAKPGVHARMASAITGQRPSGEELAAAIISALDQRVETIYLNPRLTGGWDLDDQPGSDGLRVLVQPRNRRGEFVPEPARISIVLLDPTKSDDSARVGRWDFDADAVKAALRVGSPDRGFLFQLPWQATVPDSPRLHLFVRYLTADGRKLEADREIRRGSTDRVAFRWTPRKADEPQRLALRDADTPASQPASGETGPSADRRRMTAAVARDATRQNTAVRQATALDAATDTAADRAAEKPTVVRAVAQEPTKADKPIPVKTPSGRFWKPER